MKKIIIIILTILITNISYSQCKDFFGNITECPTAEDSMTLYQNSLKVYEFYEKHEDYKKVKTFKIKTEKDVKECFYRLDSSLRKFQELWVRRERFINGENIDVLMPTGGKNIKVSQYYERVDDTKFYQREFENAILNTNSPFPLYDIRIAPLIINTYDNNTGEEFNGDEVQIALYVPVTIKPVALLTKEELTLREKILTGTFLKVKNKKEIKKIEDTEVVKTIQVDSVEGKYKKDIKKSLIISTKTKSKLVKKEVLIDYFASIPVNAQIIYYSNGITSCAIGFMFKRNFYKLPKRLYNEWSVQPYARYILQNETELFKMLKLKFGEYFNGIIAEKEN
jgi:hypothetical protein